MKKYLWLCIGMVGAIRTSERDLEHLAQLRLKTIKKWQDMEQFKGQRVAFETNIDFGLCAAKSLKCNPSSALHYAYVAPAPLTQERDSLSKIHPSLTPEYKMLPQCDWGYGISGWYEKQESWQEWTGARVSNRKLGRSMALAWLVSLVCCTKPPYLGVRLTTSQENELLDREAADALKIAEKRGRTRLKR